MAPGRKNSAEQRVFSSLDIRHSSFFRHSSFVIRHYYRRARATELARGGRRAFTLLEIILSLAILAGAIAVLGEVMRLAARNAEATRSLMQAQILASSKLAEITSGITLPASAQRIPFESDPAWHYSIALEPAVEPGLVAIRVTVAQDRTSELHPIEFSLVRWMRDPSDQRSTTTNP